MFVGASDINGETERRSISMPTDRVIEETIARCVSAMVCFHNTERSPDSHESMRIEIRAIGDLVCSWQLDDDGWETILDRVRRELLVRYGRETGDRIVTEFAAAFEQDRILAGDAGARR
jgi:hypothetical protein